MLEQGRAESALIQALLKKLFALAPELWPSAILGKSARVLELHDIQFQLCEYNKHEPLDLAVL